MEVSRAIFHLQWPEFVKIVLIKQNKDLFSMFL
jgi:hypothetical protein